MDFKALKSKRKDALKDLQTTLTEQTAKKGFKKDDRYWQPAVDKTGNGHAIIRFLPSKGDVPYVRLFSHAFKSPKTGQWYIENSRTTLGENDPVGELNTQLWNAGDQDTARDQKRKLSFISNILVVKDRSNPENEGKVFLYKYGKKIFEKISNVMTPAFDDDGRALDHPDYNPTNAYNPYDMWDGANFTLKIRQVAGYRNYDESVFGIPSAVASDDDDIKAIWEQTYDIDELVGPSQFKSYAELKTRLNRVLGLSDAPEHQVAAAPVQEAPQAQMKQAKEASYDSEPEDDLAKLLAEISDE